MKPPWLEENENEYLFAAYQRPALRWATVGWRGSFLGMQTVAFLLWEWWGSLFSPSGAGEESRDRGYSDKLRVDAELGSLLRLTL